MVSPQQAASASRHPEHPAERPSTLGRTAHAHARSLPPLPPTSPPPPPPSFSHSTPSASASVSASGLLPAALSSSPPSSTVANVKRARSVQFLAPRSPGKSAAMTGPWSSSPDGRGGDRDRDGDAEEGPMGERTPIMGSERGGGRDYRAFEGLGPPARELGADDEGADAGYEGARRRRGSGSGGRRKRGSGSGSGRMGSVGEGEGEEGDEEDGDGDGGWWRRFVDKYGSVELDNKGSVARDHLALERTFLAWLRTSLAFASIGIAITQLFRLNTTITDRDGLTPDPSQPDTIKLRQVGKPLGATFLGIAILVLILGGRRYFESQYWIIRGKFPASRGSVCLITFVAAALIVTSLIVVCTVNPTQFSGN